MAGWTVPRTGCRLLGRPTSDGCAPGDCPRGAGCHDKRDATERSSLYSLLGLIQSCDGAFRGNRAHGSRVDAEERELASGAGLLHGGLAGSGAVVHQQPPGDGVQTPIEPHIELPAKNDFEDKLDRKTHFSKTADKKIECA